MIDASVVSKCVTITHPTLLSREDIESSLYLAGFDLASKPTDVRPLFSDDRIRKHVEQCAICAQELAQRVNLNTEEESCPSSIRPSDGAINTSSRFANAIHSGYATTTTHGSPSPLTQVLLSISGMTCASCTTAITRAAADIEGVSEVNVDLLGKSASAVVVRPELVDELVKRIEEIGYECTVVLVDSMAPVRKSDKAGRKRMQKMEEINRLARGSTEILTVAESEDSRRTVTIRISGMFCQ